MNKTKHHHKSESQNNGEHKRVYVQGWSAWQRSFEIDAKKSLGKYYSTHEFMSVLDNSSSNKSQVPRCASVLANAGTTSAEVCKACLMKLAEDWKPPFHVRWHTSSAMLTSVIQDFVSEFPHCRSAAVLSLLPGIFDWEFESVVGNDAVQYLNSIEHYFTYTFLSAHRIDLASGKIYFFFPPEIGIQSAIAKKKSAGVKELFLTPSKLQRLEGVPGYTLEDMLHNSNVNIYAAVQDDSSLAERISMEFKEFCSNNSFSIDDSTHQCDQVEADSESATRLRLRVINSYGEAMVEHRLDAYRPCREDKSDS